MRITIIKLLPKVMLALGLTSIFLVGMPDLGACDTCQYLYSNDYSAKNGWDTKVSSNTATGECSLTATRKVNGEIQQASVKANDKTGGYVENIGHIESNGEQNSWRYEGPDRGSRHKVSETHSSSSGSTTVNYDNAGRISSETDTSGGSKTTRTYDNNGHITSKTWSDGKGSEQTYTYDSNGGAKSYAGKSADGSTQQITFDPASCSGKDTKSGGGGCRVTAKTEYDPKTTRTRSTGYKSDGKVDFEHDSYQDGTQSQLSYGPDGRVQSAWGYDPKTKQSNLTTYNGDGSVTHSVIGTGSDGKAVLLSKENSNKDGVHHTDTYAPGCPSNSGGAGCKIASTVDDFGKSGKSEKKFDPASGKLISQTNTGPNNYQESTTYNPKTGFMTSKSQTQADGVHTVNYTGNCSQFGGSDCHKISETTTDPKTNKIVAAKTCDNQGNCKNVDPKNLVWAGGPVMQSAKQIEPLKGGKQQIKADVLGQIGDKPSGDVKGAKDKLHAGDNKPADAVVTKNPDDSTTTVTKKPDRTSTSVTKDKDGNKISESRLDDNGKPKSSTTFADGMKKDFTTFGPTGKKASFTSYYKDGKKAESETYYDNGKPKSDTLFGPDGNKTLVSRFDDKGNPKSATMFDSGMKTDITTFGPTGKKASFTSFYKNGKEAQSDTYDDKGHVTSSTNFGPDGKKAQSDTFDDKGHVTSITRFGPNGRPTSVDTIDGNGKLTSVSCDVPAKCAKALNQQQAQLKAGANALKADKKALGLSGDKKVKSDVLKQIGDKHAGDRKGGKASTDRPGDKRSTGLSFEPVWKDKDGVVHYNEPMPRSGDKGSPEQDVKIYNVPGHKSGDKEKSGVTHTLPLTKHDADVAAGQKDKKGEMHTMPYRELKTKVQHSTSSKKKLQNQSMQKFKEKKKDWHYPAATSAPNQVVR